MKQEIDIQEHLPLREATFFIMVSLAPGAKHGYGILKEVESLSDGRVVLSTGTLYGALKRLWGLGWVERITRHDEGDSGRGRKEYCLTELGRRVLNAEVSRFQRLMEIARIQVVEQML
ncbi:MAG: helix-turn-helix transcriptional regulator [Anaerolineales bacterium]|jgi:DNA-binding PadR family transcriptional regulator